MYKILDLPGCPSKGNERKKGTSWRELGAMVNYNWQAWYSGHSGN